MTKKHGSGTYISENGSPLKRAERLKLLNQSSDALLAEAMHLNVNLEELVQLLRQRAKIMQLEKAQ